jgi:hypothetical protein
MTTAYMRFAAEAVSILVLNFRWEKSIFALLSIKIVLSLRNATGTLCNRLVHSEI